MKIVVRTVILALAAALAVLLLAPPTAVQAVPPDPSTKTVQVDCRNGWSGGAVGQYGGVSFGVACNNGRGKVRLQGTSGTAYSIRMGAESDTVALDCFFTGDSANVNESCGEVRLTVR